MPGPHFRFPFAAAFLALSLALSVISCSGNIGEVQTFSPYKEPPQEESLTPQMNSLARIFASLPIEKEQMQEVYDAASASSEGGYDEEYTLERLLNAPGSGVAGTKAAKEYSRPIRDLLGEYLSRTKAGAEDVEKYLNALSESDFQIYWPYSEDWDGEELPIVTFDPGYESDYNYGYRIRKDSSGYHLVDSVQVDEVVAMEHPVWVINTNDDAAYTPVSAFVRDEVPKVKSGPRMLYMKSFKMLRNYDSWFRGGSEFFIKCGSVNGFSASTEAELKLYQPSVTDFMVVVKRKYLNRDVEFNSVIMTDFTNQLENLAFLITEDDGGARTSWKCSASVKIRSKSYGFEVDLPYNDKDDIVWRGQLSASFFQSEDIVRGRFGDVEVSFALE